MKQKIHKFFRRGEVIGAFLILFVVFGLYSIKLMGTNPYVVTTMDIGTFTADGKLSHVGVFENNTLYGESAAMADYPLPITREIRMVYEYHSIPGLKMGNYTLRVKASYYVVKGTEEVLLWNETMFEERGVLKNGSFSSEYSLDLVALDNRSALISRELGLRRLRRRITITASVTGRGKLAGKTFGEDFVHTSTLMKDSNAGLYYFIDPEKTENRHFRETSTLRAKADVFGISSDVQNARSGTGLIALFAFLPLVGYLYAGRKSRDDMGKLRPYIVRGAPENVDRRVYLRDRNDLEKAFNLLDKPIMTYLDGDEEVYVIVDDGVAYEYRTPLPGAKRRAN